MDNSDSSLQHDEAESPMMKELSNMNGKTESNSDYMKNDYVGNDMDMSFHSHNAYSPKLTFRVHLEANKSRKANITIATYCSWEDITDSIHKALLGNSSSLLVDSLYPIDSDASDENSLISTSETFWNKCSQKSGEKAFFVRTTKNEAKSDPNINSNNEVIAEKVHENIQPTILNSKPHTQQNVIEDKSEPMKSETLQKKKFMDEHMLEFELDEEAPPLQPSVNSDHQITTNADNLENYLKDHIDNQSVSESTMYSVSGSTVADGSLATGGETGVRRERRKFRSAKRIRAAAVVEMKLREAEKEADETVNEQNETVAEATEAPSVQDSPEKTEKQPNTFLPDREGFLTIGFSLSTSPLDRKVLNIPYHSSWDDILGRVSRKLEINPRTVSHIVLEDEEGDELSPFISTVDKFWKFSLRYEGVEGMHFVVHIDETLEDEDEIADAASETTNNNASNINEKSDQLQSSNSSQRLSLHDKAFLKACCDGDLAVARGLLSHGIDLFAKDSNGLQAIHLACIAGNIEVVKWLLKIGVSVQLADDNGMTPLHHACDGMHIQLSMFLVKSGASMLVEDGAGLTALHCVCLQGLLQLVHLLRPHLINIKTSTGLTMLHCACNGGHEEMCLYLLRNGANLHCRDNEGLTPLHHACLNGHFGVARILVDHGAYCSPRDKDGMSPLLYACSEGHTHILHWLVSVGARLSGCNDYGDSPLHVASQAGHLEVVNWLIMRDINLNKKNKNGMTAADLASAMGHAELALFLKAAADDGMGKRYVEVECEFNIEEESFLRAKEQAEEDAMIKAAEEAQRKREAEEETSTDIDGSRHERDDSSAVSVGDDTLSSAPGVDSKFREACFKGNMPLVLKLISRGIQINACNANGSKPLHFACAGGHLSKLCYYMSLNAIIINKIIV